MKKKTKKGFTLVELLVAIFCASIFLTTLITALIFVQKVNKNLVSKSSDLYKIRNVKDYILDNYSDGDTILIEGDDVIYYIYESQESKTIASNTKIKNISIELDENNYKVCKIEYSNNKNKEFKFIIKKGE